MPYLLLAALLTAVAAFSIWSYIQSRSQLRALEGSVEELAATVARYQTSVTVKKTQEILTSRYTHDQVSARTVAPSPLARRINHDRVEDVYPTRRSAQ